MMMHYILLIQNLELGYVNVRSWTTRKEVFKSERGKGYI